MRINSLTIKNFKRIVEVQIKPGSNIVRIVGRNANGKSSILDAIWVLIRGAAVAPSKAIRTGADEALIEADLGDIVVRREFHKTDSGDETTSLRVETEKGAKYDSPQKMLDKLFSKLTFDPLEFARMKPELQYAELQKFVPGVDFTDIAKTRKEHYERRTKVNALANDAASAAKLIAVPANLPDEEVDITALVNQITHAGANNTRLEQRKAGRETAKADLARYLEAAAASDEKVKEYSDRRQLERVERVRHLERQIEDENTACAAAIQDYVVQESSAKAAIVAKADELQLKLNAAEPLPEPVDLAVIQAQIEAGRRVNEQIALRTTRDTHMATAKKYEGESETLTAAIKKSDDEKAAAIRSATMPVQGLGFGDGEILYKDLPFAQASDAERLRVSVAIAAAQNSKLRVLRIKDGSLLDEDGLKLLDDICKEHDMQAWLEVVLRGEDDPMGWVIEDGSVKHGPTEAA